MALHDFSNKISERDDPTLSVPLNKLLCIKNKDWTCSLKLLEGEN